MRHIKLFEAYTSRESRPPFRLTDNHFELNSKMPINWEIKHKYREIDGDGYEDHEILAILDDKIFKGECLSEYEDINDYFNVSRNHLMPKSEIKIYGKNLPMVSKVLIEFVGKDNKILALGSIDQKDIKKYFFVN